MRDLDVLLAPVDAGTADNNVIAFEADWGLSLDSPFWLVLAPVANTLVFSLIRNEGDDPPGIALEANQIYAVAVPPHMFGFFVSAECRFYVEGMY